MSYMFRLTLFLSIVWTLVAGVWWIFTPLILWYFSKYSGLELVFVAILIDGYYQYFYQVPIFTIAMISLYLLFTFIKPQLLMYTD